MERERELKFSLLDPPPGDDAIVEAFRGSGYALDPRGSERHLDVYVDTPDLALRSAGVALRRRDAAGARLATLKTIGRARGPYHERAELELPLGPHGAWPATLLARLAERVPVSPTKLVAQLELRTERRAFAVHRDGRVVADLCFDEVAARAPGAEREALFREAELEAMDGTSLADLEAIAARLERVVTLTPSGVTKLQRAEALLSLGAVLD